MTSAEPTSRTVAVVVDIGEQLLAGELLAALDDAGDPPVDHPHVVHLPGLAGEAERRRLALHLGVLVLDRRRAERVVEARVLAVADAHQTHVEQPQHGCEHLVTLDTGQPEVGSTRLRTLGSTVPKPTTRLNLSSPRARFHSGW